MLVVFFVCCKQKTAYDMRISDWSSDVCSSDLPSPRAACRALVSGFIHPGKGDCPGRVLAKPAGVYPALLIEEAAHLAAARRMLEFPKRLGLDLADALTRHRELLADFLERVKIGRAHV